MLTQSLLQLQHKGPSLNKYVFNIPLRGLHAAFAIEHHEMFSSRHPCGLGWIHAEKRHDN
jgi:hypothetical protein